MERQGEREAAVGKRHGKRDAGRREGKGGGDGEGDGEEDGEGGKPPQSLPGDRAVLRSPAAAAPQPPEKARGLRGFIVPAQGGAKLTSKSLQIEGVFEASWR